MALSAFLAFAAVAHAQPTAEPTPSAEDAKLNAIFARFDNRRDAVESRLRTIELDLIQIQTRLNKARTKLKRAEGDLLLRRSELNQAIKELDDQKLLTRDSAASLYMRGPWSHINAMLNAGSVSDMVRVEVFSESVLNDFIRVMHDLTAKKDAATKAYAAARTRVIAARKVVKDIENEETRLLEDQQVEFSRRQLLINELIQDFGGLDELRKHGFDIIVKAYSGTDTKIATLLLEAQKGQPVAEEGEYFLRWPVESRRITSAYGWRIHPLWGYRSFHTGIDIGADYGDEIVASVPGRVVAVDYMGAYGLAAIIDHGNSIATVYAHMSRAYVQAGDFVLSAERIGAVGCSGWCTGPHIHYEVRLGSKPVNPTHWL
ncbi:MAG: murein hydrolase activator EnvC family protein [Actinomycetota bacterium]